MAGNSRKIPGDIHGNFSCRFVSRLSHLPERWIAVIVRHRIVKPRLDDELAALDDLRVVDQRHGAHLVLKLGCHGCHRDTAADQLPRLV